MPTTDASQGVSNCYLFKSRLQEFSQKVGYPTPVYETVKEGPSHEPTFKSTVIVNHVRYDSLPGFYNRKAAEQSAAEVALLGLSQSRTTTEGFSQPVHETGLCKNLLQEYAQKMNYAIPLYHCEKVETSGGLSLFSCTVETGGIRYIGAAARTKKEAEIKAARTALLAIQANISAPDSSNGDSVLTVVPSKKKVVDLGIKSQENTATLKPKKRRFKKKFRKKKHPGVEGNHGQNEDNSSLMDCADDKVGPGGVSDGAIEVTDFEVLPAEVTDSKCGGCFTDSDAVADSIPYPDGATDSNTNPPNFGDGGCFADVSAAPVLNCNGDLHPVPPDYNDGLSSFLEEVNGVP